MNWLFLLLLLFLVLNIRRGARKGFLRTVVSMVSIILVWLISSWVNPYIGEFLRERTPIYQGIREECAQLLENYLDETGWSETLDNAAEIPLELQEMIVREIPLPKSMQDVMLKENHEETYQKLGVESFFNYLVDYLAYAITNGIAFLGSFWIALILVKMILYAVDLLTALPVIGFLNTMAGMILGLIQGIFWIWVFFLMITIFSHSAIGSFLMEAIQDSIILKMLYEKNVLLNLLVSVILK